MMTQVIPMMKEVQEIIDWLTMQKLAREIKEMDKLNELKIIVRAEADYIEKEGDKGKYFSLVGIWSTKEDPQRGGFALWSDIGDLESLLCWLKNKPIGEAFECWEDGRKTGDLNPALIPASEIIRKIGLLKEYMEDHEGSKLIEDELLWAYEVIYRRAERALNNQRVIDFIKMLPLGQLDKVKAGEVKDKPIDQGVREKAGEGEKGNAAGKTRKIKKGA